jgi:hypothetical protein
VTGGRLTVTDVLDSAVTYVPGSTRVSSIAGSTALNVVPDSTNGTAFPLDDAGYVILADLPRRGGTVDISFQVLTSLQTTKARIINQGFMDNAGVKYPFETSSIVNLGGAIAIDNTNYLSHDGGARCGTPAAGEFSTAFTGSDVTYCFLVTNTGSTHLSNVTITAAELNYTQPLSGIFAPKQTRMVFVNQRMFSPLTINAVVVGMQVLASGAPISDAPTVIATDPSNVVPFTPIPRINITNVVYRGNDNGASCQTLGREVVQGVAGSRVVYCFTVINVGDTHLNNIVVTNPKLNMPARTFNVSLAPGQRTSMTLNGTIVDDLTNSADVVGTPIFVDGRPIPNLSPVRNTDPSSVDRITLSAKIAVDNTVYIGRDGGRRCGTAAAVDSVSDLFSTNVTYCFKVSSIGPGQDGCATTAASHIELFATS